MSDETAAGSSALEDAVAALHAAGGTRRERTAAMQQLRTAVCAAGVAPGAKAEAVEAYGAATAGWVLGDADEVVRVVALRSVAWLAEKGGVNAYGHRRR